MLGALCKKLKCGGHRRFFTHGTLRPFSVNITPSKLTLANSIQNRNIHRRYLSSGIEVPENSYDEDNESKKEFLELSATAAVDGGLTHITSRRRKIQGGGMDKMHEMDCGLDEISVSDDKVFDNLVKGDENVDYDEVIKQISESFEELSHLNSAESEIIERNELKDLLGAGNPEELTEEKLLGIFKSELVEDLDISQKDKVQQNGDVSRINARHQGSESPKFQDYPRNESEVARFTNVDSNRDSFSDFSLSDRKSITFEYSMRMMGSSVDENDEEYNDDDAAEEESILHGHINPRINANYSMPTRISDNYPEPLLEQFIPDTSAEKFRYDSQGSRSCPGHRQRKGKEGKLYCHRIDLSTLHYLDVINLSRFITHDSEIMDRKSTGLCSKCQRKVAKTVKRARNMGILPRIGEYVLQDSQPRRKENFHVVKSSNAGRSEGRMYSKTIV